MRIVYAVVLATQVLLPTVLTAAEDCPATTPTENEAIARKWHDDVINRRDTAALAEILSPDLVHHASGGYPARLDAKGVRSMMEDFLVAFPDLHYRFDLLAGRGEFVIQRYTATGTQSGRFRDLAPTGRKATWTGINVFRIECGRIAEVWSEVDAQGRAKQLTATE